VITVHHLNQSRSHRVLWALEELEVPYALVKYDRDPKTSLAPPELQKIHPLGKSPVLVDDGAVYAESGAILEYLADKFGKFRPAAGTQAARDCRYFLHYAEGSLMPFLLLKLIFGKIKTGAPFLVRPITNAIVSKVSGDFIDPNLTRHVKFLGDHLEKHAWFAGAEISIADFQMVYAMEGILSRAKDFTLSPKIQQWVDSCRARPAFKKALDKGGPMMLG
jgi:glutathione S-transferase